MLNIINVSKSFGKNKALSSVSLEAGNEVIALMGVNGAGKTTLIRILTTLTEADSGIVIFDNEYVNACRSGYLSKIGYMPQYAAYYKDFSTEDFLEYAGFLKGIDKKLLKDRIDYVLEKTNLTTERKKKIGHLSGGMKQRLGIAQAIINEPKLLILDEPTAGLDPVERIRFRRLIKEIADGKTVLFATHMAADVEQLADRIVILDKGKVLSVEKNNYESGSIEKMFTEMVMHEKSDNI